MMGSRDTSRPLRVLHLVPQLRTGGMEQGVVKLLNGLPPERVAGSLCCFDASIDSIRDRLARHVGVHVLGRRPGNDPRLVYRLIRLLRRHRPDIVHSHSWGTLCEGYVATRLAGFARFVHGEHGTMEVRPRNLLVQRFVWGRADAVLSVSSKLADRMARDVQFGRDRITVIRNGADLSKFGTVARADAREGLNLAPNALVVGTMGRLVPVKDHDTFLASVARLKNRGAHVQALIVGDGPGREYLESRVRALGLRLSVRFLGHRNDAQRVLAAMDVFLLTSLSEGLPNAVLEAMACGVPIVSTRVGGVEELVDEGVSGFLVPVRDVDGIAAAVARLGADPMLRRRMGVAGQTKARAEFRLERMLDDYERFYMMVAGRTAEQPAPAFRAAS
jgi:sugar transferase (PEP-CTERM/EpsH1 system associated)